MALRLAIALDNDLATLGAHTLLEREYRLRVVGSSRTLPALETLVRDQHPDVLILGDWFDDQPAIGIAQTLKCAHRRLKIILISASDDGTYIHDTFHHGINAYLHRADLLGDVLIPSVDTVMSDSPFLSPIARTAYIIAMQKIAYRTPITAECLRVLRLLAHGHMTDDIAREMGIPKRRVYHVREKLRRRFDALTNEHLITRAIGRGLV